MKPSNVTKSSDDRKQTYSATESIKGHLELNIPVPFKGSKVHLEFAVHPGQILFEVLYQPVSNSLALEDIYPNAQKRGSLSSDIDDNENVKEADNSEKRRTSSTSSTSILTVSRKSITRKTGSKAIVGPIKIGNYIGSWTSEEDGGTLYVRFDNSGSWLAGKVLTYFIEVEEPDPDLLYQFELKEIERQKIAEEEEIQRRLKEEEYQTIILKLEEELNRQKLKYEELHNQHSDLHENHSNVKSVNANIEKELEAAKNNLSGQKALETAFFSAQETINSLEQKLQTSEREITKFKTSIKSSDLMIDTLKLQIQSMKETGDATTNQYNEDLKAKMITIQELQVKLKAREIEYDKLHVILQSSSSENDDLKNRLTAIKEAELKVQALNEEIEVLNSKIENLHNRNEELKVKVDVMQSELDSQINLKVNIEKQHTVLEAAFLAANQMINKFEHEKADNNKELQHVKNLLDVKINEFDDLDNILSDTKRELSSTKNELEKIRHDNHDMNVQNGALQETINEYKNTLNTLAPKEDENLKLLHLVKDLEEKLIVSNSKKTEAESKQALLESNLQHEIEAKVASSVRDLKTKIVAIDDEKSHIEGQLEKVKKDLKFEIDLRNAVEAEKASLQGQVTELEVKVVTLESKIVDYERLRTKLEVNIDDLIKTKNTLESKLASPQIVSHEATIHEYEAKLVNVDEGYRSIIAQLEERITFLEEDNGNLKAAKLNSDKEFADMIYSASVSASTAEAKVRDLEIRHSSIVRDAENKSKEYIQKLMNLHRDEMFELNGLHKKQLTDLTDSHESKLYEVSVEIQSLQESNKNALSNYESKLTAMNKEHVAKIANLEAAVKSLEKKLNESADVSELLVLKLENAKLNEQLTLREQDLKDMSGKIKRLTIERDDFESQMKIFKMYKSKVADLAEKIDADDIIPKDLETCQREIVSLRASRQLLQSIKKSLEDQNLELKGKLDEQESKTDDASKKSINDSSDKTNEPKKRNSLLGFLLPTSSAPSSPAPPIPTIPPIELAKPEYNLDESKTIETNIPEQKLQPPIDEQKPIPPPIEEQPLQISPVVIKPAAPISFNIGEFFSKL